MFSTVKDYKRYAEVVVMMLECQLDLALLSEPSKENDLFVRNTQILISRYLFYLSREIILKDIEEIDEELTSLDELYFPLLN